MTGRIKTAVLVDLPREKSSGGHVKYWERVAQAAVAGAADDIDLTVYFSGAAGEEILSPQVRYRYLPPVFSTERLKFLPYVPAHTDLAGFHPALAAELPAYDVIHTTDACFAFARTAERVVRWNNIPLVTSFHTDTPAYTEIFTRQTLVHLLGRRVGLFIADKIGVAAHEGRKKQKRVKAHLRACAAILAMRDEDRALAHSVGADGKVRPMRLGVDKNMYTPDAADRAGVERDYGIASGKCLVLFVGRVDAGKNALMLAQACAQAIAQGANLHLLMAGLGPQSDEIKKTLGDDVTLAGWVEPEALPRLYASVDCLAIASDVEIGGMIGLEALSAGCPVLVSRHSGVAQACSASQAMHMMESGADAWARGLRDLAGDAEHRASLRTAALEFRQTRLAGWDDVLRQDFAPVWREAAKKRG